MNVTISRRTLTAGIVVAVLAIAGGILWAVLANGGPAASAAPATSAGQTRTAAESAFLDAVKTSKATLSDDDALLAGQYNCKGWDKLRDGHVPDPVPASFDIDALSKDGKLTDGQARDIEYAAVRNLCPANLDVYQKH